MASGSSVLSGWLDGSARCSERTPPSMTICATWMPLGANSRAALCARPRNANLPMAKGADSAKPLTPAVAPVRQDSALAGRDHALGCLLYRIEGAQRRYGDGPLDLRGIEFREGAAHAAAGVVNHQFRRPDPRIRFGEEPLDLRGLCGVYRKRNCTRLIDQLGQPVNTPGSDDDGNVGRAKEPSEGATDAGARADDECAAIGDVVHRTTMSCVLRTISANRSLVYQPNA